MVNPKVFISYSHDSPEHMDRVLQFSDRLRRDGVECIIDQYEISPPEGWPRWTDKQIRDADFVLLICTKAYYLKLIGETLPETGLGVRWEGNSIYNHIYQVGTVNTKFISLLFEEGKTEFIPEPLRGFTYYQVNTETGYEELYRHLTNQPHASKPKLGNIKALTSQTRQTDFFNLESMKLLPNSKKEGGSTYYHSSSEEGERMLAVRVHKAYFYGRPEEYYFINLTNLSSQRVLEVTHVWYEDENNKPIYIFQRERPLPTRLDLDQSWETWIEVSSLPTDHQDDAFQYFYVRISAGIVFKSCVNPDVPLMGSVPGKHREDSSFYPNTFRKVLILLVIPIGIVLLLIFFLLLKIFIL